MNDLYEKMKADASVIYLTAIEEVKPDKAVRKAIASFSFPKGRLFLIAVGKAAWQMARTAAELIQPYKGIVISKYDHILKPIEGIDCYEAGHPILDENGIRASEKVLELVSDLNEDDGVLFLLSGGASALFEVPKISLEELQAAPADKLLEQVDELLGPGYHFRPTIDQRVLTESPFLAYLHDRHPRIPV